MMELLRTTDPTMPPYVKAILKGHGIEAIEFDTHMSVLEGSIGILPRRIMVLDDDYARARVALWEAGVALPDPPE